MKNRMHGVLAVAAVAASVSVISAAAEEDAPRWERRDRAQGAAGERRGAMAERGGQASGMPRGMGMGMGGMAGGMGRETMLARFVSNPKMAERLGLNSNQVAELNSRLDAIQKEKVKVRADLEIAGMEQAKLLSAEKIDEAALKAAVEKTGAIHTRLAMLEIQPIVELKKVLTPAQIAMAKDMVRERMRERMEAEGAVPAGAGRGRGGQADQEPGPMAPPEPPPAPERE